MSAEVGTPPAEAELRAMKVSALKKLAKEAGVGEAELEEADDADDVKATLIELIVDKMREEHGAGGADSAAELEAQKQEKLKQLREELGAMKPSALKKRAKEAGVEEEKLEEADDAEDVKGTLVELIVEKARDESQDPPSTAVKPHFSAADSGGSKAERFKALFGGKHCMFSYNWAVQEQVKAARSEVGAAGVPTWMDIDGEPARGLLLSPFSPSSR